MSIINRRSLITGLIAFAAAPAIVRVENIMRINPRLIVRKLNVYVDPIVGIAGRGPANQSFIFSTIHDAMDFIYRTDVPLDATVHIATGIYESPYRPAFTT